MKGLATTKSVPIKHRSLTNGELLCLSTTSVAAVDAIMNGGNAERPIKLFRNFLRQCVDL